MPLPPRALMSMESVEIWISQSFTSFVRFLISFSSWALFSVFSSFSTRYMVTVLVLLSPDIIEEPEAIAPMDSISLISEIFSITSLDLAAVSSRGVPFSVVMVMVTWVLSMDGKNSVPLLMERTALKRNKPKAPKSTQVL